MSACEHEQVTFVLTVIASPGVGSFSQALAEAVTAEWVGRGAEVEVHDL